MQPEDAYEELVSRSRQRTLLVSSLELLSWDELTCMPRGGVVNRGRQTAYLAGLLHEQTTDTRYGDLLDVVHQSQLVADPSSTAAANVREWRRAYRRAIRLPRRLVEELARMTIAAQQRWAFAREDDDFAEFRPWLEQVVELKRAEADCLRDGGSRYDALLDDYEPDFGQQRIAKLFAELRPQLVTLLNAIQSSPRRLSRAVLRRDYPIDRQRIFGETIAAEIGFDFECGRLDTTTHPFFSAVGPGDCRITTRYDQHDVSESLFGVLHELGHGLYEQGLDPEQFGTPCGESSSLGIHESQSRIWENAVGRSLAFWQYFFPRARELFHNALHDVVIEDFYRACNSVEANWYRVRADEVTYDLHIMVRFELERDLIDGELAAADLPGAWLEKYREYVGIVPLGDRDGCLQDSHWASGQFGYFPTYTLGNIYAAQLMLQARKEISDLDQQFSEGNFQPLRVWLRDKIFRHGQRFSAEHLIIKACGGPANPQPLVDTLWKKYRELYNL
jgi:carboxypeptidase Taq